jgi:hypothetical protein
MREDRDREEDHEDEADGLARPRDLLAQNLNKLMAATPSLSTPNKLVAEGGGSNGTIDRMRRAAANIGIDYLEPLAEAFGLEPWHLLIPNLVVTTGADGMPVVAHAHWPFPKVSQERFLALSEDDRGYVQRRLLQAIVECEADSGTTREANTAAAPGSLQSTPPPRPDRSGKGGNDPAMNKAKSRRA